MKKLLTPLLATLLVGCQQASTGANLPVDVTEDNTTAVPIEVVPLIKWTCPTCTDNEKYVLKQLQEKQESQIEMPWQRSWVILNKKVSSIPTFAREGLEFLTLIAIGVGTDSFSGPLHSVIWG